MTRLLFLYPDSNPKTANRAVYRKQNNKTMKLKFLTLDYIKQHSRICGDCEDEILLLYAKGAENNLLRILGRTYDELVIMGEGTFPEELMVAGLMLVDVLYQHRSPQEAVKLSDVAYTFEFYTKPFMKL